MFASSSRPVSSAVRSSLRALSSLALVAASVACSAEPGGQDGPVGSTEQDWSFSLFGQRMAADTQGNMYVATGDGALLWYRDNARNGTMSWARGAGNRLGIGWATDVLDIVAAEEGAFYVLKKGGLLYWYKNEPRDGNVGWDPKSGTLIRPDLTTATRLVYGGNGVLYVLRSNGDLAFYQDLSRSGSTSWAPSSTSVIRSGLGTPKQIFACGDNSLYVVDTSGNLRWYRDNARNGTSNWDVNSGALIGTGWGDLQHLFCADNGNLYSVATTGELRWWRHTGRNGTWSWAAGSGATIGTGWSAIRSAKAGYRACAVETDCPEHQECRSGACRVAASVGWCDGPSTGRTARGDRVSCGAYACRSGVCLDRCTVTADCAGGYSCYNGLCADPQPHYDEDTGWSYQMMAGPGEVVLPIATAYRETIDIAGCATAADCPVAGDSCIRNTCLRTGTWCSDDLATKYYWGSPIDCGTYQCEPLRGDCRHSCQDTNACDRTSPTMCNVSTRQCVVSG